MQPMVLDESKNRDTKKYLKKGVGRVSGRAAKAYKEEEKVDSGRVSRWRQE